MTPLPKTKEQLLKEMDYNSFIPQNAFEEALPLFLEVLIDIRDHLEGPQ